MSAATVANFSSTHCSALLPQMAAAAVAGDTSLHLRDPEAEGAGITITGGKGEAEEEGVVT